MPRGEFSVGRLLATPASYAYQKILFKYLKKDEPKIFIPSMRYAHHFVGMGRRCFADARRQ